MIERTQPLPPRRFTPVLAALVIGTSGAVACSSSDGAPERQLRLTGIYTATSDGDIDAFEFVDTEHYRLWRRLNRMCLLAQTDRNQCAESGEYALGSGTLRLTDALTHETTVLRLDPREIEEVRAPVDTASVRPRARPPGPPPEPIGPGSDTPTPKPGGGAPKPGGGAPKPPGGAPKPGGSQLVGGQADLLPGGPAFLLANILSFLLGDDASGGAQSFATGSSVEPASSSSPPSPSPSPSPSPPPSTSGEQCAPGVAGVPKFLDHTRPIDSAIADEDGQPVQLECFGACGAGCNLPRKREVTVQLCEDSPAAGCSTKQHRILSYRRIDGASHPFCSWHDTCYAQCAIRFERKAPGDYSMCTRWCDFGCGSPESYNASHLAGTSTRGGSGGTVFGDTAFEATGSDADRERWIAMTAPAGPVPQPRTWSDSDCGAWTTTAVGSSVVADAPSADGTIEFSALESVGPWEPGGCENIPYTEISR
jgi:hypothetical protein